MIRPGPASLIGLSICLVPALVLPFDEGALAWLGLALLTWLAVTVVALARLPDGQRLALECPPPPAARLGEPCALHLQLTNLHFQRLHLEAALRHDAPVACAEGRFGARIGAGEPLLLELSLTPLRRGTHELGSLRVSLRGGLGWLERVVDLPLHSSLTVHPAPLSRKLLAALYPRALPDRPRATPERLDFAGLRPFTAGDDARDLAWSASARSGQPTVRTWEGPGEGPVVILVDRGAGMAVPVDAVQSRLDRAVAVALGLRRQLRWANRQVTLAAWSSGLDLYLTGADAVGARALAQLQPAEQPWDPTDLAEVLAPRLPPAATVVVITEPDGEPEALARSLAALGRRAGLRVLLVGDPALRQAVEEPVTCTEDAYRCAAALALWDQRRRAIHRWRRSGASVLDAGAAAPRHPVAR